MDDIQSEPEWQPELLEVEQTPLGPTRVGTRKRYVSEFMGKRVENIYVATAVEPARRVAYETTPDSSAVVRSEVLWDPVREGTRVTMRVEGEPAGALKLVPAMLLERAYRKALTVALERLRERLE